MNHTEAVALCRLAQACCPQQKFDEFTPDAWGGLLDDIRFDDAREALRTVAKRQPFVSPAEIRAEVKTIRAARIASAPVIDPPPEVDPDDVRGYLSWLAYSRRTAGNGEPIPAPIALPRRDMRQITAGRVFRPVDSKTLSTPLKEGETP